MVKKGLQLPALCKSCFTQEYSWEWGSGRQEFETLLRSVYPSSLRRFQGHVSEANLKWLSWWELQAQEGVEIPAALSARTNGSHGNVFLLHWANSVPNVCDPGWEQPLRRDHKKMVLGLVFSYDFLLQGNWKAIFPSLPLLPMFSVGRPSQHSSSF